MATHHRLRAASGKSAIWERTDFPQHAGRSPVGCLLGDGSAGAEYLHGLFPTGLLLRCGRCHGQSRYVPHA